MLKIDPSDIKETQILNTYLRKEHEEDKQGILDVRILDFILFEEPTNVSDDSKPATQSNFYSCFHIWDDNWHFLFTDSQKRLEYEAREKAVRDHKQMMFEAKESGKKEGIEIGREQSKFDKSIQLAKNMLQKGLTINIIAEVTGLSLAEIEALQLKQTT
ncbi:MAG: Rpn family recombination-promoting nuclease/putative transposase [Lachnospiraceae bacterium]|nr:Rpn family recombination-promoting nuclease/putative transposase [Lachnospiraceae bacterium]